MLIAASRLASPRPTTGNIHRAANLQQPRFLEMADDECIISGALRLKRIADGLRRATEFGQRMKMPVGRIEAVDLEVDAGARGAVEKGLQAARCKAPARAGERSFDTKYGGTGRFVHVGPEKI